jgi:hypothetical protein
VTILPPRLTSLLVLMGSSTLLPAQQVTRHTLEVVPGPSVASFQMTFGGQPVGLPPARLDSTMSGTIEIELTRDASGAITALTVLESSRVIVDQDVFGVALALPGTLTVGTLQYSVASVDAAGGVASVPVQSSGGCSPLLRRTALSGTVTAVVTPDVVTSSIVGTQRIGTVLANVRTTDEGLRLLLSVPYDAPGPVHPFGFGGPSSTSFVQTGLVFADSLGLSVDAVWMPVVLGGTRRLAIAGGSSEAGSNYLVLASITGTGPTPLGGGLDLPLTLDAITEASFAGANMFPWTSTLGVLDGAGYGEATFSLPPLPPVLLGTEFHHAAVLFDSGGIRRVTNAVTISLL